MARQKRTQVIWRRNKVQELLITGHNAGEITSILKVSHQTVYRDIDYLREESRQSMQTHLQDRLPEEYQNCIGGINRVLKMSWEIATRTKGTDNDSNSNNTTSTVIDDRTRLQALALANDCYKYKMDLVTNGVVITDAIKFVQQKKDEINPIMK